MLHQCFSQRGVALKSLWPKSQCTGMQETQARKRTVRHTWEITPPQHNMNMVHVYLKVPTLSYTEFQSAGFITEILLPFCHPFSPSSSLPEWLQTSFTPRNSYSGQTGPASTDGIQKTARQPVSQLATINNSTRGVPWHPIDDSCKKGKRAS